MMTKPFAVLVLALLLPTAASSENLRVATYNLNWANRQGGQILDALATADADIICFQETTVASERFLSDRLAPTHPHFQAFGHEGRYGAERFAFASKLPLSDLSFIPPSAGLFGFCTAKVQFGSTQVHVVNVHLAPFLFRRGGTMRDAWAAVSATEAKHAAEIAAIIEAVNVERPTIIAGDFNSLSNFRAPQALVAMGFIDAYASIHNDADMHPTWHWPTRPLPLALRIDFIFHTSHFEATEAAVVHRDGSDHSLVVVELRFSKSGQ